MTTPIGRTLTGCLKAASIAFVWVMLVAGVAGQQQPQSPPPQPPSGFVAVDEVPPGEQIPAINLVATAYGFVWIALLAYVWSIARRLRRVESELGELEARKRPPYAEASRGK